MAVIPAQNSAMLSTTAGATRAAAILWQNAVLRLGGGILPGSDP